MSSTVRNFRLNRPFLPFLGALLPASRTFRFLATSQKRTVHHGDSGGQGRCSTDLLRAITSRQHFNSDATGTVELPSPDEIFDPTPPWYHGNSFTARRTNIANLKPRTVTSQCLGICNATPVTFPVLPTLGSFSVTDPARFLRGNRVGKSLSGTQNLTVPATGAYSTAPCARLKLGAASSLKLTTGAHGAPCPEDSIHISLRSEL